ncbi:MAG: hypothetical protein K2Z81_22415 [Cyanobacteria bacterium]|nr:hypothetical protein [Cyanobacteriota bacterium]
MSIHTTGSGKCDNLLVMEGELFIVTREESEASSTSAEKEDKGDAAKKKKGHLTFERNIEIFKVLATVWVAGIGTFVTMQFNERQHELNRIQAIASMLPHLSDKADTGQSNNELEKATPASGDNHKKPDMSRDGAIWAIYRTANSKTMLRDLASLFPEDIYRVVSSTAVSEGLEEDPDALIALEVASEKLAAKYSQEKMTDMAIRLYDQALRLRTRAAEKNKSPLHIVDITDSEIHDQPASDETATLILAVNKLGDLHMHDSEQNKFINTHHFQAKQLYKRARALGKDSADMKVKEQVALADTHLGEIYLRENRWEQSREYFREARGLTVEVSGEQSAAVKAIDEQLKGLETRIDQGRKNS